MSISSSVERLSALAYRRRSALGREMRGIGSGENDMYIGGGLLGTVLIVVLIVYLVRRT